MAVKFENECVGCPQGCIHCGRDKVKHFYCDRCNDDVETLYLYGHDELCEECLLEMFDKITLD